MRNCKQLILYLLYKINILFLILFTILLYNRRYKGDVYREKNNKQLGLKLQGFSFLLETSSILLPSVSPSATTWLRALNRVFLHALKVPDRKRLPVSDTCISMELLQRFQVPEPVGDANNERRRSFTNNIRRYILVNKKNKKQSLEDLRRNGLLCTVSCIHLLWVVLFNSQ